MSFSSTISTLETPTQEGIERALESTPEELCTYVLDTIVCLAETQQVLNSDDVNRVLKANGYSMEGHENALGGLFRKAKSMGWIRHAGFTRSTKEGRHGSIIG